MSEQPGPVPQPRSPIPAPAPTSPPAASSRESFLRRAEGWLSHDGPELKAAASDAAALLQPYATHIGGLELAVKILTGAAGGGPFAILVPEAVTLAEQAIADIKAALTAPKSSG